MKIIRLFFCFILMISLCACGASYRELENLQIIETIGLDTIEGKTQLTVSSGQNSSSHIMSGSGETVAMAIQNLQEYSSREDMFYAHTKYAIVGASENISPYIDYFRKNTEFRFDIGIFVVKNATAQEMISTSFSDTTDITDILSAMERSILHDSRSHVFSSLEILRSETENGASLACAIEMMPTEGVIYSSTSENVALPAGLAVLRDGAVCGFLDEATSMASLILLGEKQLGTIIIYSGEKISLSVRCDGCEVSPVWAHGVLQSVDVDCEISAEAVEGSEMSDAVREMLSQYVESSIVSAIDHTIIYNADFLGLGKIINRSSPEDFEKMAEHFPMNLTLGEINVEVDVSAM